jgi:hypothetical protein
MRGGRRIVLAICLMGAGSFSGVTRIASGAEPLDDRLGVRTALLFLLLRSDIQTDLGLEPAQIALINRAAPALYQKALSLKGKKGPGAVAARRVIDEEESRFLTAHLNDKQRERLGQIDLQWEGASALLYRPFVAEYLGLTRDQQEKVTAMIAAAQARRLAPGPWTYDEHLENTRTAISLLNEKQRQLWARVLGAPCHFVIAPAAVASQRAGDQKVTRAGTAR